MVEGICERVGNLAVRTEFGSDGRWHSVAMQRGLILWWRIAERIHYTREAAAEWRALMLHGDIIDD